MAWDHLAQPALWSPWAPHLRGAWRLGEPEVSEGRCGAVRLGGFIPVPVRITAKDPGRSWTWRAGPFLMEHRVETRGYGCDVVIEVTGPAAAERAFSLTYGPLISLLLGRVAIVAGRRAGASGHTVA